MNRLTNRVPKFCYLGDTLGAGGGAEEAARARASAKFKAISSNLTARGESYRIKGKIIKACIQSVLTYETETWSMKKKNKSAKFGEEGKDDGEMDVWGVAEW